MTLRIKHLIHFLFLANLVLVVLNAIMFLAFWKGVSAIIPVMASFLLIGLILQFINKPIPNISFQLWTIFFFTFILISYPVTLYYKETHYSFDILFSVRSYFYNFIITWACYKYTLFCIEENKLNWFLNWVNTFLIIGTFITIFAIPLGLYTLKYAETPRFLSISRMSGIYLDPNFAGFAANVTTIFSLASLFIPKSPKLLGILGVLIGFGGVIASFSKAGILLLILLVATTFFIYALMYRRVEKGTRRVTNVFLLFTLYGLFQFIIYIGLSFDSLPKEQRERIMQIENIITGKADKSDTSNRANLVELGLSKIYERPILGTGYLSFTYLLDAGSKTGDNVGVHNTFLRIWGEGGILPFILFIGFWLYLFWQAAQLDALWQRLLVVSLASAFVVYGATIHTFLEDNFIGAFIGIVIGLCVETKQYQPK